MLSRKENSKYEASNYLRFLILIFLLQFFSVKALADLPLSLEDLLTNKNEFRLSLNFGYANADRAKASALCDEIDTGNNGFFR